MRLGAQITPCKAPLQLAIAVHWQGFLCPVLTIFLQGRKLRDAWMESKTTAVGGQKTFPVPSATIREQALGLGYGRRCGGSGGLGHTLR